ncbi:hypothetical protein Z946_2884 [Sulfitobacter noctilucicola]|uniref:Uncharacterized protein n=1 Tax=Sulfitobacter noctilucicola TaxID=1342301 RepID=A0A7W6Q6Y8_9RHOB|nr:hypothetical protein [Sulfitobacter noctilucicola]KIN64001.1 hypothetical protein Z946_2884 [Sulfitobacter noctilucicola]MBB4175357.1 hypothetical protein [Sulfitobacter noctilucicola]
MPDVFKFYIKHALIGFLVAGVFVGLLLYFNVANLWHLISTSDIAIMALVVFWALNGLVFGGVQTAVAVMLMAEDRSDDSNGPRGNTPQQVLADGLIPVPQEATTPPR